MAVSAGKQPEPPDDFRKRSSAAASGHTRWPVHPTPDSRMECEPRGLSRIQNCRPELAQLASLRYALLRVILQRADSGHGPCLRFGPTRCWKRRGLTRTADC